MDRLVKLIKQIPGGFLGALGLIGLFKGSIDLQSDIAFLVETYISITNPIIEHTFGYIFKYFEIELSQFWKTYISIGVIFTFSFLNSSNAMASKEYKTDGKLELFITNVIIVLVLLVLFGWIVIFFWPWFFLSVFLALIGQAKKLSNQIDLSVFFSSTVAVLTMLFINYGLLFVGVK